LKIRKCSRANKATDTVELCIVVCRERVGVAAEGVCCIRSHTRRRKAIHLRCSADVESEFTGV